MMRQLLARGSPCERSSSRGASGTACRTAGFTLLEVMVALGLLAAALMAVADLCGNALRNHVYARDLAEATLLARGKMAELEQKYEDEGFKDFDQTEDGDFADAKRPDILWHVDLIKPAGDLSADQLVSMLAGAGGDAQGLIGKIMGGGAATAAGSASAGGPSQPTAAGGGLAMGAMTKLIQSQVTVFGETLKKSFREMRLTVGWRDGKTPHAFTVTTHLVVLNPKAPGGTRGDNPEVPANIAPTPGAAAGLAGAAGLPGLPGMTAPGAQTPQVVGPTGGTENANRRRRRRGPIE